MKTKWDSMDTDLDLLFRLRGVDQAGKLLLSRILEQSAAISTIINQKRVKATLSS